MFGRNSTNRAPAHKLTRSTDRNTRGGVNGRNEKAQREQARRHADKQVKRWGS